nr:HAD hydrolase family protein [Lentilactobacillus otakiensis]
MDGTTLNDDSQISPQTAETIRAAARQGYIVSIVTGRPNRLSENFYDDLKLETPMINFNGNLGILPHQEWNREYQYTIDKEIVTELLEKKASRSAFPSLPWRDETCSWPTAVLIPALAFSQAV